MKIILRIAASALLSIATIMHSASASEVTQYEVEASFDDVKQDLVDAVINRGYVVDYEALIGDMLSRTGEDVGSAKPIFKNAQTIQFCSAVLSRKAMEADPANIAYCPYVLFVYEAVDKLGTVQVGFRRLDEQGSPSSKDALAKVNETLNEIVREAADQ